MSAKKIRSLVVYILIVITAAAVLMMVVSDQRATQDDAAAAAAIEEARRPYLAERAEITAELAQLAEEEQHVSTYMPTLHFLFTEPDARIITEALPMMAPYGYPAMVAVSEAYFPGDEGCLTVEQLNGLLGQGWGVCLSAGADTDIPALYARLLAAGVAAPQAAYFPAGDCTAALEEVLQPLGIRTVIQYGAERPADAEAGMLWYVVARGTLDSENNAAFERALSARSGMVLTHGWQLARESFTTGDFQQNLDVFRETEQSGQAQVTTVDAAYATRQQTAADIAESQERWSTRREALTERLQVIDTILYDLSRSVRQ